MLAVSLHDLRKSTVLLEAGKKAAIPDAELHLVGRMRLSKAFLDDGDAALSPNTGRRSRAASSANVTARRMCSRSRRWETALAS